MKDEIEAKFLSVDHDEIREKLRALGAECEHPMRLMKRVIIRTKGMQDPDRDAFLRVRDEGDKVTMTYKQMADVSLSGAKEIEVVVSDFDATVAILAQADLHPDSYQESKRETWKLGETEIVLDEWPWIKPFIEIEAPSEELVKDTAAKLGFLWGDAVFGAVTFAYRAEYPNCTETTPIDIPRIVFDAPEPPQLRGVGQGIE